MIYYTIRPNGEGSWYPRAWTNEECLVLQVREFTEKFQASNPPPTPGTFKLTLKNVIDTMDSNRWPCIGGPMDGEGIAKEISLNKGAGGKKLTVVFQPKEEILVQSKDRTIDGIYVFRANHYEWKNLIREEIIEPDPWINQEEKEAFNNRKVTGND